MTSQREKTFKEYIINEETPVQIKDVDLKSKKRPSDTTARFNYVLHDELDTTFMSNVSELESETPVLFCHSGVSHKQLRQLKRGKMIVDACLDVHGLTSVQASSKLLLFLKKASYLNWRCVHIIHGKAKNKDNAPPVLKNLANNMLKAHKKVLAYCSAPSKNGGTGALYVLLKK